MRAAWMIVAFVVASSVGCGEYDYCEGKCRWAKDWEKCLENCEPPFGD